MPKNIKVRALMKDFAILRPKLYTYLTNNRSENKKPKATEKCVIKQKLVFEDYKHCFEAPQIAKE